MFTVFPRNGDARTTGGKQGRHSITPSPPLVPLLPLVLFCPTHTRWWYHYSYRRISSFRGIIATPPQQYHSIYAFDSPRTACSPCPTPDVVGSLGFSRTPSSSRSNAAYTSSPVSHGSIRQANSPPSPFSIRWRSPYRRPSFSPCRARRTSPGLHVAGGRRKTHAADVEKIVRHSSIRKTGEVRSFHSSDR